MVSIAAKMASLILLSVVVAASPVTAASLTIEQATIRAAECAGMNPEMAKQLLTTMVAHERLPAEQMFFTENFVVVQPAETKCWIIPNTESVSVTKNTTPMTLATLVEGNTGTRQRYLFAYLGTATNGEHIFLIYLVQDRDESSAAIAPR